MNELDLRFQQHYNEVRELLQTTQQRQFDTPAKLLQFVLRYLCPTNPDPEFIAIIELPGGTQILSLFARGKLRGSGNMYLVDYNPILHQDAAELFSASPLGGTFSTEYQVNTYLNMVGFLIVNMRYVGKQCNRVT